MNKKVTKKNSSLDISLENKKAVNVATNNKKIKHENKIAVVDVNLNNKNSSNQAEIINNNTNLKINKSKLVQNRKKIKIVFDARMISHSGIGTYTYNVIKELIQTPQIQLRLLGDPKVIQNKFPNINLNITPFYAPIYSLKEQFNYPEIFDDEILHLPHYNAPIKYLKRSVVTIQDLIHLQSPEYSFILYRIYVKFMFKSITQNAACIICPTKATYNDLVSYYPNAANKSVILRYGFDTKQFPIFSIREREHFLQRLNIPLNYVLHIGIGKRHKNVDFLIKALAPEWKTGKLSISLILAGCGEKLPRYVEKEILKHGVTSYIKHISNLSKNDLSLLYQSAKIFLFPSKIEGLGFPILESLSVGVPVLCARNSSLPEAGGKAAYYYEPDNIIDFKLKFYELLGDNQLRQKCLSFVPKHLKQFDWTKHIHILIKKYQEISQSFPN